jgi:hypothetical protein
MHPSVWKPRHAVYDERTLSVQRTPRARRCAALRVPMGSPRRQRYETSTHALHSGSMLGLLRIAALAPHAPLLRCRISPRRRTAPCPCPWRARRRRPAHERVAPPLGDRNSPAFARSSSARATHQQRTARPCAAGRLRVCNMQHKPMQRAPMQREPMQRAPMQCATRAEACILTVWKPHQAVYDERRRIVSRTRGVQHSASRWGRPVANDSKGVLTSSTPAQCAVHRTPLAAACVRRTVRTIHRPCRAAQHTIPRRGTRDSRFAHAPMPCCSRSSRP